MIQFVLCVNIRFVSAAIPVSVLRSENYFFDRCNFNVGTVNTVFGGVVAVAGFCFQERYTGDKSLCCVKTASDSQTES